MKIRVAILEKDELYLKKITLVLNKKYKDKLQIFAVTDESMVDSILKDNKIDVFLVYEDYNIEPDKIPYRCSYAYLTEVNELETWRNSTAVGKYQKIEMIYKSILSIYAEKASDMGITKMTDSDISICTVVSASGGTGSSSIAVAIANRAATRGKRVLYLNLEKFGNTNTYYKTEGTGSLSEVIYAIKSGRSNIHLKLETNLKKSSTGVSFFESCKNAFDIMELSSDDIRFLVSELSTIGLFDSIVIDCDFEFSDFVMEIFRMSTSICFVNNGSETANEKFTKCYNAIEIYEQQKNLRILDRMFLLYNMFRNRTSTMLSGNDIKVLGGIQYFEGDTAQVVNQLSSMPVLDTVWGGR